MRYALSAQVCRSSGHLKNPDTEHSLRSFVGSWTLPLCVTEGFDVSWSLRLPTINRYLEPLSTALANLAWPSFRATAILAPTLFDLAMDGRLSSATWCTGEMVLADFRFVNSISLICIAHTG